MRQYLPAAGGKVQKSAHATERRALQVRLAEHPQEIDLLSAIDG